MSAATAVPLSSEDLQAAFLELGRMGNDDPDEPTITLLDNAAKVEKVKKQVHFAIDIELDNNRPNAEPPLLPENLEKLEDWESLAEKDWELDEVQAAAAEEPSKKELASNNWSIIDTVVAVGPLLCKSALLIATIGVFIRSRFTKLAKASVNATYALGEIAISVGVLGLAGLYLVAKITYVMIKALMESGFKVTPRTAKALAFIAVGVANLGIAGAVVTYRGSIPGQCKVIVITLTQRALESFKS